MKIVSYGNVMFILMNVSVLSSFMSSVFSVLDTAMLHPATCKIDTHNVEKRIYVLKFLIRPEECNLQLVWVRE